MDVSDAYTPSYNHSGFNTVSLKTGNSKSSGLTLVLPALRGGKPVKSTHNKKSKHRFTSFGRSEEDEKRAPRPVKLKPLKEVLTKLIAQIKKKDDYAFFLKPVDTSQVQGYTDVVKHPMDLGTMSIKVNKNKYRSLEDFASDLRLVTENAKAFNPAGSIYYTEAERIEAWALDHISKAAATVIQYETDWNIDIERDDETTPVNIDDDGAGLHTEADDTAGRRSPSVASQTQPGTSRRGVRGPYKKPAPTNKISEAIDAEGRLPGSRDGLSAFPANSDWARTMLALKLKGKRYKTKKERLRIEKEGPPLLADGSLDYTEMEDPFSVLSVFAPEPYSRPYVTPLKPPLFAMPTLDSSSQSQSEPPRSSTPFPTSINVPYSYSTSQTPINDTPASKDIPSNTKKRHWVVIRNPTRSKMKERDEDTEHTDTPMWQTPREAHVTDFGSYAMLAGAIEEELRKRKVSGVEGEEEEQVLQAIRDTIDCQASQPDDSPKTIKTDTSIWMKDYWSAQRAHLAEGYIKDVVYGGADGLAYVRSLAEFIAPLHEENATPFPTLGAQPLATWVEREIVDPLTNSRHALLRETAIELARQTNKFPAQHLEEKSSRPLFAQVKNSMHLYPPATMALAALLQIKTHKIDMGCLIKTPEELFQSEEEWAGKVFKERRSMQRKDNVAKTEEADSHGGLEIEEPERTWMDVDASSKMFQGQASDYELEGPEELNEVMEYAADLIVGLNKKIKEERSSTSKFDDVKVNISNGLDSHANGSLEEERTLRNLRLNLLALAKRAPLDTIARLPKDLVPEHIRHFVPTLNTSS